MPCRVEIFASTARSRSTDGAEHGERRGRRVVALEVRDLVADRDGRAVALVASPAPRRARRSAARPGGPSRASTAARRARSPPRPGARGPRPARRGRAPGAASASSPAWRREAASVTASSATLRRPGFLMPRRLQVVERALELALRPAGAAVGAADRRLEAVAERALVALQARPARGGGPTPSTGRTPRSGRPRSPASSSSARAGSVIDVAAQLQADQALGAAERLGQPALVRLALLVLVGERHADRGPRLGVDAPRAPSRRGRRRSS